MEQDDNNGEVEEKPHIPPIKIKLGELMAKKDSSPKGSPKPSSKKHRNSARTESPLAADEPVTFELGKRDFRLREVNGQLVAHQNICPHLLGPLSEFDAASSTVSCPWHGYRFDLASGDCLSPAAATCRLGTAPGIVLEDGNLIARLR